MAEANTEDLRSIYAALNDTANELNQLREELRITRESLQAMYNRTREFRRERGYQLMGDERVHRMVPATEEVIESLSCMTLTGRGLDEIADKMCSICHEEFNTGCVAANMPCSHVFHSRCIETWLRISHCCPLCRYQLRLS